MLIGDKSTFAVEAYLSQGTGYIFINYCFWVKQAMVGDLVEAMLLNAVIPVFESALALRGRRQRTALGSYDAHEIISYLRNCLWGNSDETNSNIIRATYTIQELKELDINSNEGEAFQGFYTFLLEQPGYDWLLCQEEGDNSIITCKIPKNEFYNIFKNTLNWIRASTTSVLRSDYIP